MVGMWVGFITEYVFCYKKPDTIFENVNISIVLVH